MNTAQMQYAGFTLDIEYDWPKYRPATLTDPSEGGELEEWTVELDGVDCWELIGGEEWNDQQVENFEQLIKDAITGDGQ
tara:strand:- start:94 stop:330 length:237 start_codon:yes stop_codon:yes gene_type:complete